MPRCHLFAEITIDVTEPVVEGQQVTVTCDYPNVVGGDRLLVINGNRSENIPGILNTPRPFTVASTPAVTGKVTVLQFSPTVKAVFVFTANRNFTRFILKCVYVPADTSIPESESLPSVLNITCM